MKPHSLSRVVLRALLSTGAACSVALAADPPNDPAFPQQWPLHNTGQIIGSTAGTPGADIGMLDAWEIHRGFRWVRVAVVSSGMSGERVTGLSEGIATTGDPFDTSDSLGAGSHAASVLAEWTGDEFGIAGIHERIDLIPIRAFDGPAGTLAAVAAGIREAIARRAEIILVSAAFAATTPDLEEAVEEAAAAGILVIAPVGDDASPAVHFPARLPDCIAVTATNHRDELIAAANTGPEVELAAPGWEVPADDGSLPDARRSGTAVAAAHVTGAAALLRSYQPALTASDLRVVLAETAQDLGENGRDEAFGWGRIRADAALQSLLPPLVRVENARERSEPIELIPGDPGQPIAFRVQEADAPIPPGGARLFYREAGGSAFSEITLTRQPHESDLFSAAWPVFPCGTEIEFYAEFLVSIGESDILTTEPPGAPADLLRATVSAKEPLAFFDFHSDEASEGWIAEPAANHAVGAWTRGDPTGTDAQPEFDASPTDDACFYTGAAIGGAKPYQHDVDGGPIRLLSPVLAAGAGAMDISARVWFTTQGEGVDDELLIEVSWNGGEAWDLLDVLGNTGGWRDAAYSASPGGGESVSSVALRFTTSDDPNDSLTEAAIDQVRLVERRCTPLATDVDGDRRFGLAEFAALFDELADPEAAQPAGCAERLREGSLERAIDLADFACLQRWFGRN